MIDKLVLALVVIGALNWGSIGIFQFDLIAALFGGQASMISRIVYTLVVLAFIKSHIIHSINQCKHH